ncbi:hypothetical protein NS365_15605 [Aureimonas ureilytica]|uniref:Uncharacterized protein n=1 Tax=Aureimonas ureilytica TaxID=401562 RepID=A0A175RLL6_9HYPH|nr:hypothetical protein [Aureimonas ureilytica]KTR04301.1 hypothetical protein NS365_15605 [Aureimonas ureilytica]
MKRVIEPFAVEYKRRPKRGKTAETSIWSGSLGDEIKSLMRVNEEAEPTSPPPADGNKSAAKALFSKPKSVRSGHKPEGRILESRAAPEAERSTQPEPDALEAGEPVEDDWERERAPAPRLRAKRPESRTEPFAKPAQAEPEPVAERVPPIANPAGVASVPAPADKPAPRARSSKGLSRVAERRARMKGLNLEDRWKWNLID